MPHESADEQFPTRVPLRVEVRESGLSRAVLLSKPWITDELRASLSEATVIFAPWEGFRDIPRPVVPVGTGELYQALRDLENPAVRAEIALPDEQYSEVALHADVVFLPTVILSAVIAPVAVNLISDWLKKRLLERSNDADVKFEMIIEDGDGRTRSIRYEGPVKSFESLLDAQLRQTESLSSPSVDEQPRLPSPTLDPTREPEDDDERKR